MPVESDEQKIVRLFEDGDRALVAADLPGLSRIFADDYVQYDETGRASTKQDVLNKSEVRRDSIRFDDLYRSPHSSVQQRNSRRSRLRRR